MYESYFILLKCANTSKLSFEGTDVISIKIEDSPINFGNFIVPLNKILIIEPGVEVRLEPNAKIIVHGSLIANGTQEQQIKFKPNSNAWACIWFLNDSEMRTNGQSSLTFVSRENCGSSGDAVIHIDAQHSPFLDNIAIESSESTSYGFIIHNQNTDVFVLINITIRKAKYNAISIYKYQQSEIYLSSIVISECSNGLVFNKNDSLNQTLHVNMNILSIQFYFNKRQWIYE